MNEQPDGEYFLDSERSPPCLLYFPVGYTLFLSFLSQLRTVYRDVRDVRSFRSYFSNIDSDLSLQITLVHLFIDVSKRTCLVIYQIGRKS